MIGIPELIVLMVVVGFIPWIIALVDILKSDFSGIFSGYTHGG